MFASSAMIAGSRSVRSGSPNSAPSSTPSRPCWGRNDPAASHHRRRLGFDGISDARLAAEIRHLAGELHAYMLEASRRGIEVRWHRNPALFVGFTVPGQSDFHPGTIEITRTTTETL